MKDWRALAQLTVDGDPFVDVFSLGQLHRVPEIARSQRRGRMLHQVVLMRALRDVLFWLEGLVAAITVRKEREVNHCLALERSGGKKVQSAEMI